MENKVISYIGFSIKSNTCYFNSTIIEKNIKKIKVLIESSDALKNTEEKAIEISNKYKIQLIKLNKITIESITKRKNCKLIGLSDDNLVKAILNEKEDYSNVNGGFTLG